MLHVESDALFYTALAAVRWAVSDERTALQQVSTYREPGSGRGLAGFDGAGQAGIILSHVRRLEAPRNLLVIAQAASSKLPCACRRDCCSGWRSNPVWLSAVNGIAEWYLATQEPGCRRPRLVMGCLRRFFGEHVTLETIGKRNAVSKAMACEVNGEVLKPLKSLRDAAWTRLDETLMASGIIHGDSSAVAA